jgi:hypothetical protein
MVQLYDIFPSIEAARKAIKQYILDEGESYKTVKLDKHRFVIGYKDKDCKFRVRAAQSKKEVVSITVFESYLYSPVIYYKSWQS